MEEIKSTPRPPETDDVSGRTFAKVRGRFSKSLVYPKTTRGKRAGRWRAVVWPYLHIDDGSMGGGGPIPHQDYLTESEKENDIIPNYFTSERNGIFFYCIMAHLEPDNDPDDDLSSTSSLGESSGSPIVIFDHNLDTDGQVAKTFMHELGHCLTLDHPPDNEEFKEKRNDWNPFNDPPITTCMYQGKFEYWDYTTDEWNSLQFLQGRMRTF